MLAPICLFTYNRLTETIQTIEALQKNVLANESDLIIYSDGAKNDSNINNVNAVRKYVKSISGFKKITIIESKINKGLANSIIEGVSQIVEKYGKVIVLEDDIIVTESFLNFMNVCLDNYTDNDQIMSISGFSPIIETLKESTFLHQRPFPWGWATWSHKWNKDVFNPIYINKIIVNDNNLLVKFKICCGNDIVRMLKDSLVGKNNSWYVKWVFYHFHTNKYSVFPKHTLTINDGYGVNATHCKSINTYKYELISTHCMNFNNLHPVYLSKKENSIFLQYFKRSYKIKFRIKLMFSKSGILQLTNELKTRLF